VASRGAGSTSAQIRGLYWGEDHAEPARCQPTASVRVGTVDDQVAPRRHRQSLEYRLLSSCHGSGTGARTGRGHQRDRDLDLAVGISRRRSVSAPQGAA
jgi:hypothetical protein